MTPLRTIPVDLAERSYDVLVGAGALTKIGEVIVRRLGGAHGGRAFVVIDDQLPPALVDTVLGALAEEGLDVAEATLHATETNKSLEAVHHLLRDLAQTRHERADPVVALGGGVVGDVAGFAAAVYRRGCPVFQCPTTLLSMVDASVGGKTGVNLAVADSLRKNMVGAFWQPGAVLADVKALDSLPDRHLRAGLAECLKHGLLAGAHEDAGLWEWTVANLAGIAARDAEALTELVARNVAIKARVVERDEREEKRSDADPGRAALNLGHTFAHAFETLPELSPAGDPAESPLLHGEAVALGLVAAAHAGVALGRSGADSAERVRDGVRAAGLPDRVAGLPGNDELLAWMTHDKKVRKGRLALIVPTEGARVALVENPPESAVCAGLEAIRG